MILCDAEGGILLGYEKVNACFCWDWQREATLFSSPEI